MITPCSYVSIICLTEHVEYAVAFMSHSSPRKRQKGSVGSGVQCGQKVQVGFKVLFTK